MSKNQFRALLVASLLLAILAGAYDYWWPDPVSEQVSEYAYEVEPEIEGTTLFVVAAVGSVALLLAVLSFIGLLLFKNWARPVYLAAYIVFLPLYPFLGVTVYSGVSQIFYDLSVMASGAVLALIYFSPVSEWYKKEI